jgi:hypothetical protein
LGLQYTYNFEDNKMTNSNLPADHENSIDYVSEKVYRFGVYERAINLPEEYRPAKWMLSYSTITLEQAQSLVAEEEAEHGDLWEYKIVDHGETKTYNRSVW